MRDGASVTGLAAWLAEQGFGDSALTVLEALGVKVTVLHEGSVLAEGPLDFVRNDQQVIDVYLGR